MSATGDHIEDPVVTVARELADAHQRAERFFRSASDSEMPFGSADLIVELSALADVASLLLAAVAGNDEELERLRAWKAEAMHSLREWDLVFDALGRPGPLGPTKAANALAEIQRRQPLTEAREGFLALNREARVEVLAEVICNVVGAITWPAESTETLADTLAQVVADIVEIPTDEGIAYVLGEVDR